MRRGLIRVEIDASEAMHVYPQLGDIPVDKRHQLAATLASHLGCELHKAREPADPLGVDPRYPWLATVIAVSRRGWVDWAGWLVRQALGLLGGQPRLTGPGREALGEALDTHRVGVALSFGASGAFPPAAERRARQTGIVHEEEETPISLAYRMGRSLNAHTVAPLPRDEPPDPPSPAEVVRQALAVPLTAQDEIALDYAEQRAGLAIRRPVQELQTATERVLLDAERDVIAQTVAQAVGTRQSAPELARKLREVGKRAGMSNDMERVAVTELHSAAAWGAYQALKAQAQALGQRDPLVYKTVNRMACADCRRIWGDFGARPTLYRLSQVEQHEAAGGNFDRPRAEWGPTWGPTHPRCTCPPLAIFQPEIEDAIRATVAEMKKRFRR